MPPYPVICYAPNCGKEAVYKVAAQWSDGVTGELKTYYLSCPDCLAALYQKATFKRNKCQLAPGESLSVPGIYSLARGERDRQLLHCEEIEKQLSSKTEMAD